MTKFDRASLDRFLPAVGQADWADVIARFETHRHRRRRLLVALVVAAIVIVGTASAFGMRASLCNLGVACLPPEGATPSTPETGELAIALYADAPPDGTRTWFFAYSDGRLISWRNEWIARSTDPFSTGYFEQQLPPESVEELRSHVIAATRARNGAVRDSYGYVVLSVRDGDRIVQVDRRDGLDPLLDRLAQPESWVPDGAREGIELRPYVPSAYAFCYGVWPAEMDSDPARVSSALPAPARDFLGSKDTTRQPWIGHEGLVGYTNCAEMTTEDARALSQVLDRSGFEVGGVGGEGSYSVPYVFEIPGPGDGYAQFYPVLPHGEYWIGG